MEEEVSTCETIILLVDMEVACSANDQDHDKSNSYTNNTVVGIELILRYELKNVTTLGEVIAIAASSADNNVRIVT